MTSIVWLPVRVILLLPLLRFNSACSSTQAQDDCFEIVSALGACDLAIQAASSTGRSAAKYNLSDLADGWPREIRRFL